MLQHCIKAGGKLGKQVVHETAIGFSPSVSSLLFAAFAIY